MSKVNTSQIEEVETQAHQVPWKEQFEDHENKIEEYIQNCIFRGCSVEGAIRRKAELQTVFRRIEVADSDSELETRHVDQWRGSPVLLILQHGEDCEYSRCLSREPLPTKFHEWCFEPDCLSCASGWGNN